MNYNYTDTIEYLLDWYDNNARILPWRENPKPYYVWISEIMLQQTRVEAVKIYFDRFINTLPDIKSLAYAKEEQLLKLWEGLGYYNRVRNLGKAARIILEEYNGELPPDYSSLLKLPGIGSYTAGAIASIAFQIPEPAVDGNVLRVMKRVAGSFDDITKASIKKELEQDIREIIPKERPGDFNQAIMELGATVCIPNGKPICMKCPIMHLCKAYHNKTEMSIPVKQDKKARKVEDKTILVLEKSGTYYIRKRHNEGLLAGLWELPSLEGKLTPLQLEEYLKNQGYSDFNYYSLGEGKHIFSHIEWHMTGFYVHITKEDKVAEESVYNSDISLNEAWVTKKEIDEIYTLPSAFEKYRGVLENRD
ncbi:A/G-specific adenine glycosylase [Anaerocolumna sedimenticola]|uniref:Adenine DNA glycosylase n=1 Tax=Anaerocolumna sedimenticola TaxID=2696063 RepID=A0A6P1TRA6_9FIRM|nr:A/G-specific adenine glycosylase [Anaerocolumna sedimenticola]QHQ62789.1 A/G-specific adenine glycosylase [Anaerocolumna sedimenticola]